jgi:predicted peroxiredoxin
MSTHEKNQTSRRGFLGSIATGAAAMGIATLSPLQQIHASPVSTIINPDDPAEEVFKNLKGTHRIAFDVVEPVWMMPFAWPRVFLMTNEMTGSAAGDSNVVVILRHGGIAYAFDDKLWSKYNFAEMFNVKDGEGKPVTHNVFWKQPKGTYKIPPFGEVPICIDELQDSGVKFLVCNAATSVFSAMAAQKMNMKGEECYEEWKASLLPGMTLAPSGVWAVGRAHEYNCAYCYAG